MLLSNDKQLFNDIILEIEEKKGIQSYFIEKDYYAITILKELFKRDDKFVFKGGTSLSVCQHVINRFSEDVDVSYVDEVITQGNRRRIKQIFFDSIEASSLSVSNPDNIRSRRIFNRYLCPYSSNWNANGDKVIVEWSTITPSFPIEEKEAQTIIGKYLQEIGRNDLVEKYELQPFKVKTITKERTLVDKIFAICDYHISKKLDRQSRHVYDIYKLSSLVKLDESFIELFKKVKEYREKLDTCYSAKEGKKVSTLLMELIKENTYQKDYKEKTYNLLYDHIKYEECLDSIKHISEFLKENNY